MKGHAPVRFSILVLAVALVAGVATPARAQGFISPLVGDTFGGDSGCQSLTDCEDKRLNVGVAFGKMGNVFGFEEEIGYAKDFFGATPGLDSSVLTLMSDVMLAPKIGPVRPYVLGGLGLIKTHVSLTPASVLAFDNNNAGWDLGGGVMGFFGSHVGVRGEVRYLHSFQDLNILGIRLSKTKLDFGRASAGLVLKF